MKGKRYATSFFEGVVGFESCSRIYFNRDRSSSLHPFLCRLNASEKKSIV